MHFFAVVKIHGVRMVRFTPADIFLSPFSHLKLQALIRVTLAGVVVCRLRYRWTREAMKVVSEELGVPLMEVYRVASFYKAFKLSPSGKNVITMCMGTACHVRGAKLLLDQATTHLKVAPGEVTPDGIFSVEHVNCLGACAQGPIVTENESYHHHMTPGKLRKLIDGIRRKERKGGKNA